MSASRYRVLGRNLEHALTLVLEGGPVDLVCFTGDIADFGLPEEYTAAHARVTAILNKLKLEAAQLVAPGNKKLLDGEELITESTTDMSARRSAQS